MKKSFRAGLLGKEEEIAILRASAAEQKAMYETALRDLKRQVKQTAGQTQARGIHQASSAHAEELLQYQKANSQLKKDLSVMQERFKVGRVGSGGGGGGRGREGERERGREGERER